MAGRTVADYGVDGPVRRHAADDVPGAVGKVEAAVRAERQSFRRADAGGGSCAAVAGVAGQAGAGHGGDDPALRIDPPDAAGGVAQVERAVRSVPDRRDHDHAGADRRPAVALVPRLANPAYGADRPAGVDHADVVMAVVGDGGLSLRADRHVGGVAQVGAGRRAAVAPVGAGAVAGDGADRAAGVDAADALVPAVGKVDRAVGRDVDAGRAAQVSAGRRRAVADAGPAQHGGDGAGSAVVPAEPAGAVAPEHGAVRVGPDARLNGVAAGPAAVQSLLAPRRHAVADQGGDGAGGGVHLADAEAVLLAHVQVVVDVEADRVRHQRGGLYRRTAVAVGGALAVAQHGGDDAGAHVDAADAVVGVVADVQVAARVEGQVLGVVEGGVRGGAAVAVIAHQAEAGAGERAAGAPFGRVVARRVTGEQVDDAGARVDAADVAGPFVGQVDVAAGVDRHSAGAVEFGVDRRAAVAAAADPAAAGHPGDDAGAVVDAADRAVAQIGQVQVAGPVLVQVVRLLEPGCRHRAAVAIHAGHAVAAEPVQDAAAVDAPDAVAPVIVDDQVAVRPPRHPHRPPGGRLAGRDALPEAGAGQHGDAARRQGVQRGAERHAPIIPRRANALKVPMRDADTQKCRKAAEPQWRPVIQ